MAVFATGFGLLLALAVRAGTGTIIQASEKTAQQPQVIRRHQEPHRLNRVVLDEAGGTLIEGVPVTAPQVLASKAQVAKTAVARAMECNRVFKLGAEDTLTCDVTTGWRPVTDPEGCRIASARLPDVEAIAAGETFDLNTTTNVPNHRSKFCFVKDGKVMYNPTNDQVAPILGTPVCWRERFPNATTCPQGFGPIADRPTCIMARNIVLGDGGDADPALDDVTRAQWNNASAPKGCFRHLPDGFFGFNVIATEGGGWTSSALKVCKPSEGEPFYTSCDDPVNPDPEEQ